MTVALSVEERVTVLLSVVEPTIQFVHEVNETPLIERDAPPSSKVVIELIVPV